MADLGGALCWRSWVLGREAQADFRWETTQKTHYHISDHIYSEFKSTTQTLSVPLYVNAGLVWKVRVLFLFPWLLVLSLVLISKRFPKRWRPRGLKEWIGARNVLSESLLRMTVGPVTIVPVYSTFLLTTKNYSIFYNFHHAVRK